MTCPGENQKHNNNYMPDIFSIIADTNANLNLLDILYALPAEIFIGIIYAVKGMMTI